MTIQAYLSATGSYFVKAQFLSSKGTINILLYDKKNVNREQEKEVLLKYLAI